MQPRIVITPRDTVDIGHFDPCHTVHRDLHDFVRLEGHCQCAPDGERIVTGQKVVFCPRIVGDTLNLDLI